MSVKIHNSIVDNYILVKNNIKSLSDKVTLIVVSKTFSQEHINPILNLEHKHFGENRVQEALVKWRRLIDHDNEIKLHMLGKVQSNKVSDVVSLFSYVHSLDNIKLADKFSSEEIKAKKKLNYFIQINIGNEKHKTGVAIDKATKFIDYCRSKLKLNVIGVMCLPPFGIDPLIFFIKLHEIAKENFLKELSMGMSHDYLLAIKNGATYVRVGSAIFGERSRH